MCGIVGVIGREPARASVRAMMETMVHRGPDGEGLVVAEANGVVATLGHRRLALLDLAGGVQPMEDSANSVWVTYNGELYGFGGLRDELERQGVRLATRSDTEIIAAGFAIWGERLLPRLNGMFAFAAFDRTSGDVLLARDPMGIKPLYYATLPDGSVAFASELTALLAHPDASRRMSHEGVASFFFSDYAHPPTTCIEGVWKLAPGEAVWIRGGRLGTPWVYTQLDEIAPIRRGDADELLRLVAVAVDQQLVADVPVGLFVSGGLDSSVIAALARRVRPSQKLLSFSIAFEDPSFDESSHAKVVSDALGLQSIVETLDAEQMLRSIDEALGSLDEPLNDHSILPSHFLARLASRHVKAVLTGDGADELFAGYPTYLAHGLPARVARPVLDSPIGPLLATMIRRIPASDGYQALEWKLKRFVLRWDRDATRRHFRWMSALDLPDLRRAMGERAPLPPTLRLTVPAGRDAIAASTFLDRKAYMPGSVLTKVDRATMAHSLEARPPFLDDSVVRYALALRSSDKVRGSVGKWLLRRAAATLLPARILERGKHGFGVPTASWLRGPLRTRLERVITSSPLFEASPLSRPFFRAMANAHGAKQGDHAKALWSLIVLDSWMERTGARW